ncbi:MAG TPA: serine protease [Longimicrobium sp.]
MPDTPTPSAAQEPPVVQLLPNTDAPPYHSICYMWIKRRRGWLWTSSFESSAVLVGDRHLLTAAHNVRSNTFTSVEESETVCAVDTDREWHLTNPFGPAQIRVPAGYRWRNFNQDYAVIRLAEASPRKSHFRLPRLDERPITTGTLVHVAGFPAADGFQNRKLYYGSGAVSGMGPNTFQYAVDTGGGMSGCPVWVEQRTAAGSEYVVVGVHVGFSDGWAVARRVDEPRILRDLETWTHS